MISWLRKRKVKRMERNATLQPSVRPKMKFGRSLMTRYMLLILAAVLFVPVIVPLLVFASLAFIDNGYEEAPYGDTTAFANMWESESKKLNKASDEVIDAKMEQIHQKYPRAAMYRVSAEGKTMLVLSGEEARVKNHPAQTSLQETGETNASDKSENAQPDITLQWSVRSGETETLIPSIWTANYAIQFMKKAFYRDPFTVVAYVGGGNEDKGQGFMVVEVNRKMLEGWKRNGNGLSEFIYLAVLMLVFFVIFILLSILFFAQIRKRLVRLQTAMAAPDHEGIPNPVHIRRSDEIGHLEESFNQMVYRLTDSIQREREEEQLRKRLVAGLSHDLRTPLTVIRGHMHALHKENLSEQGIRALGRMEKKMQDLSELIDNMLSYNLLTSGRYTLKLEQKDVLRMVREAVASWYPVWEKENFEIDIDLPEATLMWDVDEQGMRRVLDNLFQNVVRHAASGKYIRISTEQVQDKTAVVIEDHGPGIQPDSGTKGTGLGLSIVDLLIREMGLRKRVDSSETGVRTYLYSGEKDRQLGE